MAEPEFEVVGLSGESRDEWPSRQERRRAREEALDYLRPESAGHERVLRYLQERLRASENAMANFHSRWNLAERRLQAYVKHSEREKALKEISESGRPQVTSISIPYSMAVVSTIVTYLSNVFLGRRPIFQIRPQQAHMVKAASNMEQVLQYQADHTRLAYQLMRYLRDGEVYGLQVMKVLWQETFAPRTVWRQAGGGIGPFGETVPMEYVKSKEDRLVYSGNMVESVDPFMFFPDPSVPMSEVNRRGEFVAVRSYQGTHLLKALQADGKIRHVDALSKGGWGGPRDDSVSVRNWNADGHNESVQAFRGVGGRRGQLSQHRIDQIFIEIIPAELGLGEVERPERWVFAVADDHQIIQAEPLDYDHGRFPVVVGEPYSSGYGFGHPGIVDYHGPLQDGASWFLNSHMQNVRESINNIIAYNPHYVDEESLNRPGPGQRIRLKNTGFGVDIDKVLKQFNVQDVTRAHTGDMRLLLEIGDALGAVNENLRGQPHQGGRKTATEVVTAAEAGASRLAAHAMLISAQSVTDLAEQMCLNTQQFLEGEFFALVSGDMTSEGQLRVGPEQLVGDFYFPPADGTLPVNKVALFDHWSQFLLPLVLQDPELRQKYDPGRIFEFVGELGGAKNLANFRRMPEEMAQMGAEMEAQVVPDEQLEAEAQRGNVVPLEMGA